jgi:hypothetical protein
VPRLSRLGVALRTSFDQTGEVGELNQAIEHLRAAATAQGQPEQAQRLANPADALRLRGSAVVTWVIWTLRLRPGRQPTGCPLRACQDVRARPDPRRPPLPDEVDAQPPP